MSADSSRGGVAIFVDDQLRFIDPAAAAALGYDDAQEALGRPLGTLLPCETARLAGQAAEVPGAGEQELSVRRRDGSVATLRAWVEPVVYEGAPAVEVILRDRPSPAFDDQAARHARLALLGELLAALAHELNSPLTDVVGLATLLENRPLPPQEAGDVARIASQARRAARIVHGVLQLARQRPASRERVDPNRIVREALELEAALLRARDIESQEALDPAVPAVLAQPQQLQEVVLNLLRNAEQAVARPGCAGQIAVSTSACGGQAVIRVADNGCGISREEMGRVFEPFYSTKPSGERLGMGLALCRRIVEAHGGEIRVDSEVGRGTAVTVVLPAAP
ncbi:MAG: sensor histidine kinase [Candidatus Brocadiia bacterium]